MFDGPFRETMMRQTLLLLVLAAGAPGWLAAQRRPLPTPASVLGFAPGADRRLVEWGPIVRYLHALDAASDRVSVRTIGRSTNGLPFLAVFVSSAANLQRLPALRAAQRLLADPRLSPDSAAAARLAARTPAFVLITSSVHSTEVGGFFAPLEIAYRLGIPIERLTVRPDPNMDAVAAEYTTLLRASLAASADTGLGSLQSIWNRRRPPKKRPR